MNLQLSQDFFLKLAAAVMPYIMKSGTSIVLPMVNDIVSIGLSANPDEEIAKRKPELAKKWKDYVASCVEEAKKTPSLADDVFFSVLSKMEIDDVLVMNMYNACIGYVLDFKKKLLGNS